MAEEEEEVAKDQIADAETKGQILNFTAEKLIALELTLNCMICVISLLNFVLLCMDIVCKWSCFFTFICI